MPYHTVPQQSGTTVRLHRCNKNSNWLAGAEQATELEDESPGALSQEYVVKHQRPRAYIRPSSLHGFRRANLRMRAHEAISSARTTVRCLLVRRLPSGLVQWQRFTIWVMVSPQALTEASREAKETVVIGLAAWLYHRGHRLTRRPSTGAGCVMALLLHSMVAFGSLTHLGSRSS